MSHGLTAKGVCWLFCGKKVAPLDQIAQKLETAYAAKHYRNARQAHETKQIITH